MNLGEIINKEYKQANVVYFEFIASFVFRL